MDSELDLSEFCCLYDMDNVLPTKLIIYVATPAMILNA